MSQITKTFLTLDEASEFLGIRKGTLYNWTHRRIIKSYKPNGKKLYFKVTDLESFILSGENQTADEIDREATKKMISEV